MLASFSNGVRVPEMIREIACLMILKRKTLMAHDFLQRHQIGIDLCEHPSDAFDANPAVESPALVDVVRGNAESIHRLHLILDQRCQHLFGLLPCATLLPLGEFHAFTPCEIGGENSPELVYQRRIMKTDVGFFA
jgi:hypothetical protein